MGRRTGSQQSSDLTKAGGVEQLGDGCGQILVGRLEVGPPVGEDGSLRLDEARDLLSGPPGQSPIAHEHQQAGQSCPTNGRCRIGGDVPVLQMEPDRLANHRLIGGHVGTGQDAAVLVQLVGDGGADLAGIEDLGPAAGQ